MFLLEATLWQQHDTVSCFKSVAKIFDMSKVFPTSERQQN